MSAGRWTQIPAAALLLVALVGVASSRANDPAKQRDEQRKWHAEF